MKKLNTFLYSGKVCGREGKGSGSLGVRNRTDIVSYVGSVSPGAQRHLPDNGGGAGKHNCL